MLKGFEKIFIVGKLNVKLFQQHIMRNEPKDIHFLDLVSSVVQYGTTFEQVYGMYSLEAKNVKIGKYMSKPNFLNDKRNKPLLNIRLIMNNIMNNSCCKMW